MSSTVLQFRRGTTTQLSTYAGQNGELLIDTTQYTISVQDGSTNGGHYLSKVGHTHVETDVSGLGYQSLEIAGTLQTVQPILNLSNLFTASNDTPNNRTTVSLANNNTSGAGTVGSATQSAVIAVNAQGLITSISPVTIAGVVPAGAASGDLGSNYPSPSVVTVGGQTASNIANATSLTNNATNSATASTIVKRDSSGNFSANVITASFIGNVTGNCNGSAATITGNLTGDVTSSGMVTTLSASGVTANTYGDATHVAHITVDAKGRITAASAVAISGVSPSGGAGGDLGSNYPNPIIVSVGGLGASVVADGVTLANNATPSAVASEIVLRDGAGNAGIGAVFHNINVVSSSATPTFNLTLGSIQQMTITSATTIALSGLGTGQMVVFDFIHDGTTTNYALTWPGNVFGGGTNVGVAASKHNIQAFYCDGTNLYRLTQIQTDI
jgi:hypothetical protein